MFQGAGVLREEIVITVEEIRNKEDGEDHHLQVVVQDHLVEVDAEACLDNQLEKGGESKHRFYV